MRRELYKLERIVGEITPFLLGLLIFLIFLRVYLAGAYSGMINVTSGIIAACFVVDVVFKFNRVPDYMPKNIFETIILMPYLILFRTFRFMLNLLNIKS